MRVVTIAIAILWLVPRLATAGPPDRFFLPDPQVTPGVINPEVTQDTIGATICRRHWTATIRPPKTYTQAIKWRLAGPFRDLRDYELDHLIPLALGGAPADPRNMWLQPWAGPWNAGIKDRLEIRLQHLVCQHRIPLAIAQEQIVRNWIDAYRFYCADPADCPSWESMHGRDNAGGPP